jgi:hypothetical protein
LAQHMVYGPNYDESAGLISSVGVTGDMTLQANPIYYFRGRMLNANSMQFYIVNSNAAYGPYAATKVAAQN